MEIIEILDKLDVAVAQLLNKEIDILNRGLNELNLNGHLTKYLTPLFTGYDVDPEYNGDKLNMNDRKALDIARKRILEIGIEPNEMNRYKFTPDIVIHLRNIKEENLVVIEIKKDISPKKEKDFDLLKLEHLTIDYSGNHYNYKLGVALVLGTKAQAGKYEIKYFQNGALIMREDLR